MTSSWIRRSVVALMASALLVAGGPSASAGTAPGVVSHNGLEATASGRSFVAWKVHLPSTGQIDLVTSGAGTDGPDVMATVIPSGLVGHYGFGGGGGPLWVDLRVGSLRLAEARQPAGGGAGVGNTPAGDYYVVGLISGGTLGIGSVRFTVQGPPGLTELGFTSGPLMQLSDADFVPGPIGIPLIQQRIIGSVPVTIAHHIFGTMSGGNQTTSLGYRDPDGTGNDFAPGGGVGWFGMGPGTYSLRVHETSYLPTTPVVALVADFDLP